MAEPTDLFNQQLAGFSGPGQGMLTSGVTKTVLPPTDGDAKFSVTENTFDVKLDSTGELPREVYRLGQTAELIYPSKTADMKLFALATRGDLVFDAVTPPTGFPTARNTIQAPTGATMVAKKTEYAFDFWRTMTPLFDASGDPVPRTSDEDLWGVRFENCVISPNGDVYTNRNGDSAVSFKVTSLLHAGETLFRLFNTDL